MTKPVTPALDQSMKNTIAANGLIHFAVSVTYYDHLGACDFKAMGQWLDSSKKHGRGIAVGTGETIAEAMQKFAAELVEKRRGISLADEALPEIV